MGISAVMELSGVRSLPFAVGAYLPLSTTSPIFTRFPSMDCVAIYIMAFMPCSQALENIVAFFQGTKVGSFLFTTKIS